MTSSGQEIMVSPPPTKTHVPSTSNIVNSDHLHDPNAPLPWSTGLCECYQDWENCCLTYWCPCITFGRIAEIVDRGSTPCGVSGTLYLIILFATGCSCIYSCFYRSKMRGQFFLEEKPCNDICIHCWCELCALCQESRELRNRGFDLSIGWYGNMETQRRANMAPPMAPPLPGAGGMNRR